MQLPLVFSLVVLALHAAAMFVDEFLFHWRRGLPAWERWGHPVDTASVLLCYLALLIFQDSQQLPWIYGTACVVSCLCITKDEWVHKRVCMGTEQWLHAVLFVLHPVFLYCAWLLHRAGEFDFLAAQALLVAAFGIYQLVYWNFIWRAGPVTELKGQ